MWIFVRHTFFLLAPCKGHEIEENVQLALYSLILIEKDFSLSDTEKFNKLIHTKKNLAVYKFVH